MNKVILTGRIVKDPELKKTQSNISLCRIRVAVDRRFKDKDGNKITDFLDVVAWRQQADVICNYMHKGSKIGIVGSLQSRSYDDDDGTKRYVLEVNQSFGLCRRCRKRSRLSRVMRTCCHSISMGCID